MKPSEIVKVLTALVPLRLPILIEGPPGVGKTTLVGAVATDLDYDLVVSHPVVSEPIDWKGMPFVAQQKSGDPVASWVPYGDIRKLIEAKKKTLWLIDDLGQAPLAVQAALMQWIHKDSRVLNGHRLSDLVSIVCCTNRREDRAGVSGFLEPVKSRFATILKLEVDHNEWADWATTAGNMPPTLVAYILYRPEMLSKPDPNPDLRQSPSPRAWEHVGLLEREFKDMPANLKLEILTGAVGEPAATDYMGFLQVFDELPDLEDILARPTRASVPTQAHTLYALCGMLAHEANSKTMAPILAYANRMREEFQVMLMKFIARINPSATETAAYVKWATAFDAGLS